MNPRAPIYVSDFGYGTTDAVLQPKDDYAGLANIVNLMLEYIDRSKSSGTDRKFLTAMRDLLDKCLKESTLPERQPPFEVLKALLEVKRSAQMGHNHVDPISPFDLIATRVRRLFQCRLLSSLRDDRESVGMVEATIRSISTRAIQNPILRYSNSRDRTARMRQDNALPAFKRTTCR